MGAGSTRAASSASEHGCSACGRRVPATDPGAPGTDRTHASLSHSDMVIPCQGIPFTEIMRLVQNHPERIIEAALQTREQCRRSAAQRRPPGEQERPEPRPSRAERLRSPTLRAAAAMGSGSTVAVQAHENAADVPSRGASRGEVGSATEHLAQTPWLVQQDLLHGGPIVNTPPSDAGPTYEDCGDYGFEIVPPKQNVPEGPSKAMREDCAICFGKMKIRATPECGHALCTGCFKALQDRGDIQCPICRRETIDLPSTVRLGLESPPSKICIGYVVLRAPHSRQHLLGFHRCDWPTLSSRLNLSPKGLAGSGFHLRCAGSMAEAVQWWTLQGRDGHPPMH